MGLAENAARIQARSASKCVLRTDKPRVSARYCQKCATSKRASECVRRTRFRPTCLRCELVSGTCGHKKSFTALPYAAPPAWVAASSGRDVEDWPVLPSWLLPRVTLIAGSHHTARHMRRRTARCCDATTGSVYAGPRNLPMKSTKPRDCSRNRSVSLSSDSFPSTNCW